MRAPQHPFLVFPPSWLRAFVVPPPEIMKKGVILWDSLAGAEIYEPPVA
jgi:hypothetical protein